VFFGQLEHVRGPWVCAPVPPWGTGGGKSRGALYR
jgi:hypothetical protein